MTTFDSTKSALSKLLEQVVERKIQLPDFQRGWIWDDSHIRSLLVSIARSFPIGSIMLLETGGAAKFQVRPIEGIVSLSSDKIEKLILDGQQRITSLTQVLKLATPVQTKNDKGNNVHLFYYIDITKALSGNGAIDDAIFAVDASKMLRTNFGRDVVLDLSDQNKEFAVFCFPCSQILNSDSWEEGLMAYDSTKFAAYMEFRKTVLNAFREYQIPIIELKKETSKEAVCLVFEKVNTGGVPLSVFELVTATYAADGFNLRDDWYGNTAASIRGRQKNFALKSLLRSLEPNDFLQGISLLHSYEKHVSDIRNGKTGKEITAVSAKREHILDLPLQAYKNWADKLTEGFFKADQFLRMEGFHNLRYLPYRTQLVPLAAVMVHINERWLEPIIRKKICRWYWCGVLGELYGGAVETRIALDLQDLLFWINNEDVSEPKTVIDSGFQPSRLDTLRTRTSAAYRGIYILLQRSGSRDFFWKARMVDLDRDEYKIDIHHIFPRDWCSGQKIQPKVFNAIINKTPISYKANRMIGGKAPSQYIEQIQNHAQVQITADEMDDILKTHLIDPLSMRCDDFLAFYNFRKQSLIKLIEAATGKAVLPADTQTPSDDEEEDEEVLDD
ncbi:MAG TPA: DUF262 domain-containing protein [Smithella sp.]|nr:DUF262 domain-containing protein [Smithella sp.]HOG89006.1 DUF262 domain-containing protein [Smithella sp.]